MMKYLSQIGFYLLLLFSCDDKDDTIQQADSPIIAIQNNTTHTLKDVSIFSMPFEDIEAGETTGYKQLNFNEEEDDPMIYLYIEDQRLAKYIEPIAANGKYTYVIDSVQVQRKMIFMRKEVN